MIYQDSPDLQKLKVETEVDLQLGVAKADKQQFHWQHKETESPAHF